MQVKDLSIGSYVKDNNTCWYGSPIIWQVVDKNHSGYAENTATLFAKEILMVAPFDNIEPSYPSTISQFQTYGNNSWSVSNIRQWLNSDQTNWWTAPEKNIYDTAPNGSGGNFKYDNIPGFLSNFSSGLRSKIIKTPCPTYEWREAGTSYKYKTNCEIYLPSALELGVGASDYEGVAIDFLNGQSNNVNRKRPLSNAARTLYSAQFPNVTIYDNKIMTRSNDSSFKSIRIGTASLSASTALTKSDVGVCPMFNISADTEVELDSSDGVYVLKVDSEEPPKPERLDLTNLEITFTERNTNKSLTGNFELQARPYWNSITSPTVNETFELKRGTTKVDGFTKDTNLTILGSYTLNVTITDPNYADNSKTFTTTFTITSKKIVFPDSINFKEKNTNTVLDSGEFEIQARPTWDRVSGSSETITLTKDGSTVSGFTFEKNLTDIGSYNLTVLLTDVNDNTNTKSYSCSFKIVPKTLDLPTDLKFKDKLTTKTLSGQFKWKAQPTWTEYSSFTENISLSKDGSIIPFNKEDILTEKGIYVLTVTLTDPNYPTNTKDYSTTFNVDVPEELDLDSLDLEFKDKKSGKDLIDIFYSSVIPTWNNISSSIAVQTISLTKDGSPVSGFYFEKELSEKGTYVLTVNLTDVNYPTNTKDFTTTFSIKHADVDLSKFICTAIDLLTSKSLSGEFVEKAQPTWSFSPDLDNSINLTYTLSKDGSIIPFNKEDTLTEFGSYELKLTITDVNNSANTRTFTNNFEIVPKKQDTSNLKVVFTEKLTNSTLSGDFEIQAQPTWTVENADGFTETYSLIKDNSPVSDFSKEKILTDFGRYTLTVKLTDNNRPTNFKEFSTNFRIIPEQIDFSAVEITLTDKLTTRSLVGIFEEKVQPTWVQLEGALDINETYELTKDGIIIPFNYEDLLTDMGEYQLIVTLTNKKDPTNYKNFYGNFEIIPAQIKFNDLNFEDKLTNTDLSGIFDLKAQPTWEENTNPSVIETYELTKDGVKISNFIYENVLTELGSYELTVRRENKNDPNNFKVDTTEFIIVPEEVDLNAVFTESFTLTEITNGSEFIEKARIKWEEVPNTNMIVNIDWIADDGTTGSNQNLVSEQYIYRVKGTYTITYIVQDNYHPFNQLTGSIEFKIVNEKLDLSQFNISIKDKLTSGEITNGSHFIEKVQPWISYTPDLTTVEMSISMYYEGSYIPFTNTQTLTNIGTYRVEVTLTDKSDRSNTITDKRTFYIDPEMTDLNLFVPSFINKLNKKIIKEGDIFLLPTNEVQPYWADLPSDLTVLSYELFKNNEKILYDHNTDILNYVGDYIFKITVQNKLGQSNTYKRFFRILESDLDLLNLNIIIFNILDKLEITEGKKYVETQVKPDWKVPEKVNITYSLHFNDKLFNGNFVKGETILSDIGKYTIILNVEEIGNTDNFLIIQRNFFITNKKLKLDDDLLHLTDDLTSMDIADGQVFPISVLPNYIYDDPEQSPVEVTYSLYLNGNQIRNFIPGKYTYSDPGDYIYTVTLTDPNYPDNSISKTVNFKILAQPIDLTNREIIIEDKITNKVINFGEVFKGLNPSVQPTWLEYSDLKYSYNINLNNSPLSGYKKENILRNTGEYRLYVRATDPNYPTNYIEKEVVFYIEIEQTTTDPSLGEDAYLNGLPYVMGTPITDAGEYDLILVRRNPNNFKYSLTEVQFTVVDDNLVEKPMIFASPILEKTDRVNIKIYYPKYSVEREFKINATGNWESYNEPFDVVDNCTIYARCKDGLSDYFGETSKIIDNIDKTPPEPPTVLGFQPGRDVYFTVTPTVAPVYGCEYSAVLNGVDYQLGTPIYNEGEVIKEYTLVVTATKKINGLTASTTVRFILDSIPPEPPTIIGINPNVIQTSATPDVLRATATKSRMLMSRALTVNNECDYEGFLNGNVFELGSLVEIEGSYRFSATAIKKSNGLRATSTAVFTILRTIPESLEPQRLALIPLKEKYKAKAIDGEFLVDYSEGHLSIYDDGILLSKTRELEEIINFLDKKLNIIEINITNNESKILGLFASKDMIKNIMDDLIKKIIESETDVINMNKQINSFDFSDTSELDALKAEARQISNETDRIGLEIDINKSNITGVPDKIKEHVKGLINNASIIAECIWYKENKNYI